MPRPAPPARRRGTRGGRGPCAGGRSDACLAAGGGGSPLRLGVSGPPPRPFPRGGAAILLILAALAAVSRFLERCRRRRPGTILDSPRPGDEVIAAGGAVAAVFPAGEGEHVVTAAPEARVRILPMPIAAARAGGGGGGDPRPAGAA
jgi:preprotein translocase subunit YajC